MRNLLLIVFMFMLATPVLAQEQSRKYEIGWNVLSYARQGSVNLYGGDLSFTAHATPRLGIVADVAIHKTTTTPVDLTITAYRFGPRFYVQRTSRIRTFGEVLVGGVRVTGSSSSISGGTTTTTSASSNGFSLAFGGGIDIGIRPWFALRAPEFDYSYHHFSGIGSNGMRVGLGILFRFGQ